MTENIAQQDGGKMIDSGTYGCIFDPPLRCDTAEANRRAAIRGQPIGKVSKPEDAKAERDAAIALKAVPNSSKYFVLIYPKTLCALAPPKKQADDRGFQTCKVVQEYGYRSLLHYQMPWGGITIQQVFKRSAGSSSAPFPLEGFVERMLEIGAVLALNSVIHFDIHRSNILFDEKTLLPRLIDFGFAFTANTITMEAIKQRRKEYDAEHMVEPPEITIFTGITRANMSVKRAFMDVAQNKIPLRDAETLLGQSRSVQAREFMEFWNSSRATKALDWIELYRAYWSKFDAWSIGGLLLTIYRIVSGIPSFQQQAGYSSTIRRMKEVARGLVRMSPRARLDCVEALALWNSDNHIITCPEGTKWLQQRDEQRRKLTA